MKTLNRFFPRRPGLASIAVAFLLALGVAVQARAEVIYALTSANGLLSFDSASPRTTFPSPFGGLITGLQPQEQMIGIGFSTGGSLFGVGIAPDSSSRLYEINRLTGAATMVGSGPFSPRLTGGGSGFGFTFDPGTGQARLVSSDQNLRIDPVTGTAVAETPLAYAPGEPDYGATPGGIPMA